MKTKPRNTKNKLGTFSGSFRDKSLAVSGYKPKVFQLRGKEYIEFQKRGLQEKINLTNKKKKKVIDLPMGLQTMNIGFYIVTPILIGVFLGLMIDRMINTKPGFTIFFICIGTIASFYNLFRLTKK